MPSLDNYVTEDVTVTTYTVTYTGGVDDDVFFEDQVPSDLLEGDATPSFNGTPAHDGYTFKGWSPAVAETVTGDESHMPPWIVLMLATVTMTRILVYKRKRS